MSIVTLNVAEKPSVAKGISEILSRGSGLQKVCIASSRLTPD